MTRESTEPLHPHLDAHLTEPDYGREVLEVPGASRAKMMGRLTELYGPDRAESCYAELERIMQVYHAYKSPALLERERELRESERFTEQDVILITYGDLIRSEDTKPLEILADFTEGHLKGAINTVHILPFFPYSSDRGFSVIDFEQVDPNLGNWDDILRLKADVKLMFDGVFNHISSKSRWFQEFLDMNPEYQDFFTVFSTREKISADHLRLIVRPRTSELLSSFDTLRGPRMVWTTFSRDQIDLNFKNPRVLLMMAQILLYYIRRGADLIRLDAVTYLWAELGTSCVHLMQTHTVIKLFRDILDVVAPQVALVSETNVPHEENIQYFGDGSDEAQMVYNFALPPLVLHTFQTGSSQALTAWASGLEKVSDTCTYFNILDCHDGIGVMGARGILSDEEIEMMALRVLEHGGFISYKDNGDGSASPYELNTTWYSALNRDDCDETADFKIRRFLASRAIALVMMGVPGVYLHGLFGSRNDAEAVLEDGQRRSINRRTFDRDSLYEALEDRESPASRISRRLADMIKVRTSHRAFHPNAPQQVMALCDSVFTVLRSSVDGAEKVLCITNITAKLQSLSVGLDGTGLECVSARCILSEKTYTVSEGRFRVELEPYEVAWLSLADRAA